MYVTPPSLTASSAGATPSPADATRAVVQDFLAARLAGDTARLTALFADEVDWLLAENPAVPWIRPRSTAAESPRRPLRAFTRATKTPTPKTTNTTNRSLFVTPRQQTDYANASHTAKGSQASVSIVVGNSDDDEHGNHDDQEGAPENCVLSARQWLHLLSGPHQGELAAEIRRENYPQHYKGEHDDREPDHWISAFVSRRINEEEGAAGKGHQRQEQLLLRGGRYGVYGYHQGNAGDDGAYPPLLRGQCPCQHGFCL